MGIKKTVRMLLRVSSNQQLEADGDLSVQRQLVKEYIDGREDWVLDGKEYFEGSNSGYQNALEKRDTLQEALTDAKNGEYQILAAYKDDRVGRRMWEIGAYIMALKSFGVDTYTVKDGCISPETDDIMGQMMLALRYGNAQKSSSDTGMRVKDTAQKLVQKGRFMGGCAPYGYELVLSGEISKHGRALHKLKIIPEQADVVKHIYSLSLQKEFGSCKIARILNEDAYYKRMAPGGGWKSGTVTSILTNPVYAGYTAYKRRERKNGQYHRLHSSEWIKADTPSREIQIIESAQWDKTQEKRKMRADKYRKKKEEQAEAMIRRNQGQLPLIDVIHCGYCNCKLTNGSKYNYWTLKGTGERRSSVRRIYRCPNAKQGLPHNPTKQFQADEIEDILFHYIAAYIGGLQSQEAAYMKVLKNQQKWGTYLETEIKRAKQELEKIVQGIEIMESHIPDAMTGEYVMTLEELTDAIRRQKEKAAAQQRQIREKAERQQAADRLRQEWEEKKDALPSWQQIFQESEPDTKRVIVNALIERIEVTKEQVVVRFRMKKNEFLSRMSGDSGTIPYRPGSR